MARYSHITPHERLYIAKFLSLNCSMAEIAQSLERARSTIKRELERNGTKLPNGQWHYQPDVAQQKSEQRKKSAGYGKGSRCNSWIRGIPKNFWCIETLLNRRQTQAQPFRFRWKNIFEFPRFRNKENRTYDWIRYKMLSFSPFFFRKKYPSKYKPANSFFKFPSLKKRKRKTLSFWYNFLKFRLKRKRRASRKPISRWFYTSVKQLKRVRKRQSVKRLKLHPPYWWVELPAANPGDTEKANRNLPATKYSIPLPYSRPKQETEQQWEGMSKAEENMPVFKKWELVQGVEHTSFSKTA